MHIYKDSKATVLSQWLLEVNQNESDIWLGNIE